MELIDAIRKSYIPSSCRWGIFQQQKIADEVLRIDPRPQNIIEKESFQEGFRKVICRLMGGKSEK